MVTLPDTKKRGFHPAAEAAYEAAVEEFALDLANEVTRLESGQNGTKAPPQVTSIMVQDALFVFRRGPRFKRKRVIRGLAAMFFPLGALALGTQLNSGLKESYWQIAIAALFLVFTLFAGAIAHLQDER